MKSFQARLMKAIHRCITATVRAQIPERARLDVIKFFECEAEQSERDLTLPRNKRIFRDQTKQQLREDIRAFRAATALLKAVSGDE